MLVKKGATLTIEPGATVNTNNHEIRVNGTLRAIGTSSDKIIFKGFSGIVFSQYSNGWNQQTNAGCIIENASLEDFAIRSRVSLKIANCEVGWIDVENSSLIYNNIIKTGIKAKHSNTIHNNIIEGHIEAANANLISENNVGGEVLVGDFSEVKDNIFDAHVEIGASVVSNCILKRGIEGFSTQIYDCTIYDGGIIGTFLGPSFTHPVKVEGLSTISNNKIYGGNLEEGTMGIFVKSGHTYISDNIITDSERGIHVHGDATINRNLLIDNRYGIWIYSDDAIVKNNTITNNSIGIIVDNPTGSAIIEQNLITKNTNTGIVIKSSVTIQKNTISENPTGMRIYSDPGSLIIKDNNIEKYDTSIRLSGLSNVDVTSNWWDSTDSQEIDQKIYDSKYDFDIGTVIFIPFLNSPNPNAMPNFNPTIPTNTPTPTPTPPNDGPTSPPTSPAFTEMEAILGVTIIIAVLFGVLGFLVYLVRRN